MAVIERLQRVLHHHSIPDREHGGLYPRLRYTTENGVALVGELCVCDDNRQRNTARTQARALLSAAAVSDEITSEHVYTVLTKLRIKCDYALWDRADMLAMLQHVREAHARGEAR